MLITYSLTVRDQGLCSAKQLHSEENCPRFTYLDWFSSYLGWLVFFPIHQEITDREKSLYCFLRNNLNSRSFQYRHSIYYDRKSHSTINGMIRPKPKNIHCYREFIIWPPSNWMLSNWKFNSAEILCCFTYMT